MRYISFYTLFVLFLSNIYAQRNNPVGLSNTPVDKNSFYQRSADQLYHRLQYPSELQDSNLTVVGNWAEGVCEAVEIHEPYAFIESGRKVQVLDISHLDSVRLIGEYTGYSQVMDIKVQDSLAYVLVGRNLVILDVSDPTNPVEIGNVEVTGTLVWRMALEFPHVYVICWSSFVVLNIADSHNPFIEASIGAAERSADIVARDHRVYVGYYYGDENGGFDVMDVTDPTHPRWGLFVLTGGTTPTVCVNDTLLFASYSVWHDSSTALLLNTYSISNPDTPVLLQKDTIAIDHGLYYSALPTASMTMIDSMIYIATLDSGIYKVNVAMRGAYKVCGKATRSNNIPLIFRNQLSHGKNKIGIAVLSGVWFLDAKSDEPPKTASFLLTGGSSAASVVRDNYLIVSQGIGGFVILDVSNPCNPIRVSALEMPRRTTSPRQKVGGSQLAVYGNYLYLQTTASIEIADISDIRHPFWLGFIPLGYYNFLGTIKADSCYAYLTLDTTITIYSVSNPAAPWIVGSLKLNHLGLDVVRVGDYLYISEMEYGFEIVNISDLANPKEVRSLLDQVYHFAILDTILYASRYWEISLLSFAQPDSPIVIDTIKSRRVSRAEFAFSENYLYAMQTFDVLAINTRYPLLPKITGYYSLEASGISAGGKYLYLSDDVYGLQILRNDLITSAEDPKTFEPFVFMLDQNYPNPFNPITDISYALPNSSYVLITVFNFLGQEVVKLVDEFQEAGYRSVKFDASNLPSGVYFYQLHAGKFIDVKKMLVTK